MITFTYPDNMKNSQLEQVLTAIEEALSGRNFGDFVTSVFHEAVTEHGEREVHELLGSYLASWCEACAYDDPPDEDTYKRRAMKFLAEGYGNTITVQEMRNFQRSTAHYHGKVATRCDLCGRLRHGMKWKKNRPTPEGWIELEATCPNCESQDDYHSPNPDPTERDMLAWLAEGEPVA